MRLLLALLALCAALLPGEAHAEDPPYPLPDGTTLISFYDHPYYGGTWLVRWRGSDVLAIPNIYHRWALSFYAADVLLGR